MLFLAYRTLDCDVLVGIMVSSSYSTSNLGAGSGRMFGVNGLADLADLERGYHLGCSWKDIVAHHDAVCINVLVCILCVIELEFQRLGFF